MPNTGNTQQQINYGAAANDGQGDPLRTAFIKTDDNFDNVWLAGPVGSNITIGNNTIQSNNTNGNIVLKPNGTGIIQANASIIPNTDGVRDLGSSSVAWRRAYIDELLPDSLTVSGDAVIGGNLTVEGDTIQIGNITTDTLTIQLANTAANAAAANGAGITVGANDDIATILYNATANRWNVSVGMSAVGNISAPYFSGNGSLLTGIASYGNANVAANLAAFSNNPISTTGLVNTGTLSATGNVVANAAGNSWSWVTDTMGFPSGASWRSDRFSLDEYISSAVNGYMNFQTYDAASNLATELHMEHGLVHINIYNGSLVQWEFDDTGNLTLPGNTFAVNYANGTPVSLSGTYGNANVAANLVAFANNPISTTGNITANYFLGNAQGLTGNITNLDSLNFSVENISALIGNNGVNIGAGGFNNLLVLPTDVLVQNVPLTVAGNIVANETDGLYITANLPVGGTARIWNFDTNGDLTVPNYVTFAGNTFMGDEPAAGTPYFRIDTPLGYPATITTDADISGNNWSWTFGADGNLALPSNKNIIIDGGDGVIGPVSDDLVISWDNEEIRMVSVAGSIEMQADSAFRVQTNYDGANAVYNSRWEFNQDEIVNITGDSAIVTEAGNLTLSGGRNGLSSGNTTVRAVNVGVLVADWIFDNAGNLSYPDGTISTGGASYAAANASVQMISNNEFTQMRVDNANVEIYTSPNGVTQYQWTYGNTGVLTAPGNISTTGNISATGNVSGDVGLFNDVNVNNAGTNKLLYTDDNRNIYDTGFSYDAANGAISGSGNITAANFIGNISITGNVTGTSSNVTLIAGSYSTVFDNTGNTTLANGTVTMTNLVANGTTSLGNTSTVTTSNYQIGYRDIPQVALSANATAALTDAGKHYYSTTAGNLELVLPDNVSVAIPTGATLTIVVNAAGNVLVGQGTGVSLYQAGASATGNRVVGAYGLATVMKVAANTWVISGTGVY